MADVVFVGAALAFFGLSYLFVLACDRIVGKDPAGLGAGAPGPADAPDAGGTADTADAAATAHAGDPVPGSRAEVTR